MSWLFPWILLFFFLFFCGIFILIFYYARTQDKAVNAILHQQQAVRMELDRLATALDALLADRMVDEDEEEPDAGAENRVPGLDRLLLGPSAPAPSPGAGDEHGLPDLKL